MNNQPSAEAARQRLSAQDWHQRDNVQAVFAAVEAAGYEARIVGGAVRDALLGEVVGDVDMATTAPPDAVIELAAAAGLRSIPTGIDHGTVTLLSGGESFELTTLREDVETHGRHATVRFGTDWQADACRRDFTMNALYLDRHGCLHDPLGGFEDCLARRVCFIGDARQRIREDYLRILRFFRFFASYGAGQPEPETLLAISHEVDGLDHVSAERVNKELLRTFAAPLALTCVEAMRSCGVFKHVLGGLDVDVAAGKRLDALRAKVPELKVAGLMLAVLSVKSPGDAKRLREALKLSNELFTLLQTMPKVMSFLQAQGDWSSDLRLRHLLYTFGRENAVLGIGYAYALDAVEGDVASVQAVCERLKQEEVPVFPVTGADLIDRGIPQGREIGLQLSKLEGRWIESGFCLKRGDLLTI